MTTEALTAIKAKPLEWKRSKIDWDVFSARGQIFVYDVMKINDWEVLRNSKFLGAFKTDEEAKAAAQSDYDSLIFSAIDPKFISSFEEMERRVEELEKRPSAFEVLDTENGTYLTRSEQAAIATGYEYNGLYRRALSPTVETGEQMQTPAPSTHVQPIVTSIDTMREAAKDVLVKRGWKPGNTLGFQNVTGLMAEFGMQVYRGEIGCDYPNCGCCADAACEDAINQHPDLGGTPPQTRGVGQPADNRSVNIGDCGDK